MRRKIIFYGAVGLLLALGLSGCDFLQRRRAGDAVVQVNDKFLYLSDIESIVPNDATPEDSLLITERYIEQWATEQLLYQNAKKQTSNAADIERMVEDYRRSLYVHEYQQNLLQRKMPRSVSVDSIVHYYEQHPDQFKLREDIIKGTLLIVPINAPDRAKVERLLRTSKGGENNEEIEKYAYQYAQGYAFFQDQWQPLSKVLLRLPQLPQQDLTRWLRQNDFLLQQDSAMVYLLSIADKKFTGDPMPLQYAEPEIESYLKDQQRIQALKEIDHELYLDGVKKRKIVINKNVKQ